MYNNSCRVAIFADRDVGKSTAEFILRNYVDDLVAIICTNPDSLVYKEIIQSNSAFPNIFFFYEELKTNEGLERLKSLNLDYIILAWWPYIIKQNIISIPSIGVINFHPSLLPFNRGMNYNFWTIIEETPFGVTLHFVDESIDGGDIIFQSKISKDWEDTGATLYQKAQVKIIELFYSNYINIRNGNYTRIKQNLQEGSFHYGKELHNASKIDLSKTYTGKEILNILRARTFAPHPGAWFEDGKEKFEIQIKIKKI